MFLLLMLKEVLTEFTFCMSNDDAISIMNNFNLVDKEVFYNFFTTYKK